MLYVLSSLECNLAIILGSLPALLPLLLHLPQRFHRNQNCAPHIARPRPPDFTQEQEQPEWPLHDNTTVPSNRSSERNRAFAGNTWGSYGPDSLRISLREGLQYTVVTDRGQTKVEKSVLNPHKANDFHDRPT
jgi:hypothetical protein